jgi:hypothetical protein
LFLFQAHGFVTPHVYVGVRFHAVCWHTGAWQHFAYIFDAHADTQLPSINCRELVPDFPSIIRTFFSAPIQP